MKADQLAYASFAISGDAVQPESWTTYFDVVPDVAITKGDPIRNRAGNDRGVRRRTGVWSFSSETEVQSDMLAPHFRFLVARLALPRADLRERLDQQGASARFFCFWVNESGQRLPDVPDDIREIADAMGVEIDIDEYR